MTGNVGEHPIERPSAASFLLTPLPAALAIAVFGVLYGAAARPPIGPEATVVLSLLVFSGALQFATVGLIAAGAGPAALLLTALTLNLRHLVMGAVLRARIRAPAARRALLAAVLVDETFGFAVAASTDARLTTDERSDLAERTLAISGVVCYAAWIAGSVLGVLGAGLPGMERLAAAVFPVLFIGLAALTTRTRSVAVRTVAAAAVTAVICVAVPDVRALAPVVAGVLVAIASGPDGRLTMDAWLIAAMALVTYGSRAMALLVLPQPSPGVEAVLARMPAPIFASLATLTLIGEGGRIASVPVLTAAVGALLMTPRRSLAMCLLGGFVGYVAGELVA